MADFKPTYKDRVSKRPTKRRAVTPTSKQAEQVEALFAKPDREIQIPSSVKPVTLPPPPEIVANIQGSSAGAGSGEFHVYKASRRREYERLRLMEEEVRKEKEDFEFNEKKEKTRALDEQRTSKNRAKRDKAKARKLRAKQNGGSNNDNDSSLLKNGSDVTDGKIDVEQTHPPDSTTTPTNSITPTNETMVETTTSITYLHGKGLIIQDDD